ncbi:GAF domain-containing protein [Desulfobacter curvatus]|uniref:GAF domain-containing protein n=1 Tax=Desulfobacter curvatus TaxID=2290 RepID=UPI00036620F0|nr:GAF domain-containing protein [Desulfobacter curvatus]
MAKHPPYQELQKKITMLQEELAKNEADKTILRINQKRLQSLWKLASMTDSDFKTVCGTLLEEIVVMSESQYGFYGFVSDDEKYMQIFSWSSAVFHDCAIHTKPIKFPIEKSGIWGNAIRQRQPVLYNDYDQELANKRGVPVGHVKITRLLSVPVFSNHGKIVALGCVANKDDKYDANDIKQLTAYLTNAYLILEMRKTEEDRKVLLKSALSELKILRGILPLCSFCKKIRNDEGYWERVDVYISKYSQADISHSICPDCMEKHYTKKYPDLFK